MSRQPFGSKPSTKALNMALSQKEQSNNFTWGVAPGYGERGLWSKK